jgi:alkylglycerol monooxygenase
MVSYLFANISSIGSPMIFLYGLFIFVYVYAFAELMDGNKYAPVWDLVKSVFGVALIFLMGDWFGSNDFSAAISYGLIEYFGLSFFVTLWLMQQKNKIIKQQVAVRSSVAA